MRNRKRNEWIENHDAGRVFICGAAIAGLVISTIPVSLAGPQSLSVSDLRLIPPASELECPKTEAEPKAANAPHEIKGLVGGATLTYTQALGNLKAALEGSVSPEAMKALEASPQAKDPVAATQVAVGAMAAQKPLATVAYAIKAHEIAPNEPVFLANLSGIANFFGLHREALAFADKAQALPKKLPAYQQAVLLSNKGYALTSLGRPQEAEAALAEAIRIAPDLSEAYTNMAHSLGDQDKCDLAVRYLRAGLSRRPADVFKSNATTPIRTPLSKVIDLSKGKVGVLPPVPIATSPEEATGVKRQLDGFKKHTESLNQKFENEGPASLESILARRTKWAERGVAGRLTADFAEALLTAFGEYTTEIVAVHQTWLGGAEQSYHPDPEVKELGKAAVKANFQLTRTIQEEDGVWTPRYDAIHREYEQAMKRCEKSRDPNTCESLALLKKNTGICLLGKELGAKREKAVRAYHRSLRELYAESHRRASALAAHFSDPAHKQWTQLALGGYAAATLDRLVNGGYQTVEMLERVVDNCKAAEQTPQDILFDRLKQMMEECQASSKAKASISVIEVSATCEQIEIGVSTPGPVGLFGQVSYKFSQRYRRITDPKERFLEKQAGRDPDVAMNLPGYGAAFDGELSIYAGGQVKVGDPKGVVEAGAKFGNSTTFDGYGDIVKVETGRYEVSGSVQTGAGGIGAGMEYDLTPQFAPRFGTD